MTLRTPFKARCSITRTIGFMVSLTSRSCLRTTQNTVLPRILLTVLLLLAVKTLEWSAKLSVKSSKKCRLSVMISPLETKTVTSIQLMAKITATCLSIKTPSAAKSCKLKMANLSQGKTVMKTSSLRRVCSGAQPRPLIKSLFREFLRETTLSPDLSPSTLRLLRGRIPT